MGKYSIDEATLKEVADSIRAKTEITDEIPVTEFASRIGEIKTEDKVTLTVYNDSSSAVRVYYYDWITEEAEHHLISSGSNKNIKIMSNSIVVIRMDYHADTGDGDYWFVGKDDEYYYAIVSVARSDKTIVITDDA